MTSKQLHPYMHRTDDASVCEKEILCFFPFRIHRSYVFIHTAIPYSLHLAAEKGMRLFCSALLFSRCLRIFVQNPTNQPNWHSNQTEQ